MWNLLFAVILGILLIPFTYLAMLAIGAAKKIPAVQSTVARRNRKFIIAIAAHDESAVIENSVRNLHKLDYPPDRFCVTVVADHCTDETALLARRAGAVVFERNSGTRGGKGAALSWLFDQIWESNMEVDAVVIFDADTIVDKDFLRVMNQRLANGDDVIQGQHIIANPHAGWFPLLTWAMFMIDNRFQNHGRVNLGFSAKHMGDSICFRAEVLRNLGCGSGLTEDYDLRQKLLLCGIRILYEPAAKGYGEAANSWTSAGRQRIRWLRGADDTNKKNAPNLLRHGLKLGDRAMIDGALQGMLPSFSTVTLAAGFMLAAGFALNMFAGALISWWLVAAWAVMAGFLFVYPIWGLLLERAPWKAYLVIMTGPVFIFWQSWLAFKSRFIDKRVTWVRTPHGI